MGPVSSKYRKKPVVIEAVRFSALDFDSEFWKKWGVQLYSGVGGGHVVRTLEGDMRVSEGDMVIRGVANETYPCKIDIFMATYEVLSDEQQPWYGMQEAKTIK